MYTLIVPNRRRRRKLVEMAKALISKTGGCYDSRGCSNRFTKLTESLGVKWCFCQEKAIEDYKRNRRAHRIGCGPAAFGLFKHYDAYMGKEIYGYIVEIVTVWSSCKQFFYRKGAKKIIRIRQVIKKLEEKIGFDMVDCHSDNFGINRFGLAVCIDFGVDD